MTDFISLSSEVIQLIDDLDLELVDISENEMGDTRYFELT